MDLEIFTTGGTFDKIYFDALSEFCIGDPAATEILETARVQLDYTITPLLRKDSLELNDADRQQIRAAVETSTARQIIITHGTDTMIQTAKCLSGIAHKTIILTGAMQPAICQKSDAAFNLGGALAAVQLCPEGVWIFMSGRLYAPDQVQKNRRAQRFEAL